MKQNDLILARIGGMWVVGRYEKKNDVDMLNNPRLYLLMNNQQHAVMNMPSNTSSMSIMNADFYDVVENVEIADLYTKQVSDIDLSGKIPSRGGLVALPGGKKGMN